MLELTALQVDYSQDADTEQDSVWRQVAIPVEYSLGEGNEPAVDLDPVAVELGEIKVSIGTQDLSVDPIDDLIQADVVVAPVDELLQEDDATAAASTPYMRMTFPPQNEAYRNTHEPVLIG